MRTYTVQGIILKRKNVGEADRILTVFTKEEGKMQIKAKGVRKIASKRASHVEPLNICSLTIYKGNGMPILTEATAAEHFSSVKMDLQRVGLAYHICELVDGLCPENQESEHIYNLLTNILYNLNTTSNIHEEIHDFEISLLTHLGYWSKDQKVGNTNTAFYIENILERRLKARQILPRLMS